jgi:hypothetical protein
MIGIAPSATVYAAQSASSSYSVDQVFFGNGGELNACSASYCTKQAAGETTVGNTSSTTYQAQTGFNIDRQEYIEFNVTNANVDLGTVTSGAVAKGSANFYVKAYLSSGYNVTVNGPAPTNSGHQITPMTGSGSTPGTEQFGINLVANSSPSVGASPVQVPSTAYSFGVAATGYDTANTYKYNNGDIIASAPKSSGETDYTISYIMNISNVTPGGTYTTAQSLVATATF